MRILLLGLGFLVAAGCGGSSTSGGSGGSGGSSGSSGSGGAAGSGGSGATGGSAGDASTDGGFSKCFDAQGNFAAYDLKTCGGAGECSMIVHQTDCCGNTLLLGVASNHLKELQACEQAWRATLGACGCPAGPPSIEKPNTTVADPSAAAPQCDNFTQTSGICLSEPK